jgi:hypothetical protein
MWHTPPLQSSRTLSYVHALQVMHPAYNSHGRKAQMILVAKSKVHAMLGWGEFGAEKQVAKAMGALKFTKDVRALKDKVS